MRWLHLATCLGASWAAVVSSSSFAEDLGRAPIDEHRLALIREFIFPKQVARAGQTFAFRYRDDGYRFDTLEQINEYNVDSQHISAGTAGVIQAQHAPLESPFRSRLLLNEGGAELIAGLDRIFKTPAPGSSARHTRQWSVLAKAVAQRDLYQTYGLVALGQRTVDDAHRQTAVSVLRQLSGMIAATLLDEAEYRELVAMRPRQLPAPFSDKPSFKLRTSYLPAVLLRDDPTWLELSNGGDPFKHFTHFRGRSFVRVLFRSPGLTTQDLRDMRARIFAKYGNSIHTRAVEERVPRGFETMLIRSFGVLLKDGSYRDSSWPEEVIIRAFKYEQETKDLKTSDFRGTVHYQYRLSRERLLRKPDSLGLVRILDDEEEFFGFYGDVPDLRNAYSASTTTMRVNCMSCHAELYYGFATVFSLERNPAHDGDVEGNDIWKNLGEGRFELQTEEYKSLSAYLSKLSAVR